MQQLVYINTIQMDDVIRDSNGNTSSGIFGYHSDHSDGEGFLTFGTKNSSGTFPRALSPVAILYRN